MRNSEDRITIRHYSSPCGEMILGSFEGKLCLCDWQTRPGRALFDRRIQALLQARYEEGDSGTIAEAIVQLEAYFHRERKEFELPLLFVGTDFRKAVWSELLKIPYGTLLSYAGLARRLATPGAVRAVAGAVGANPLSIFVPCHRVIGSDGKLTGYAGGLPAKKHLMEWESLEKENLLDFFEK